MGTLSREWVILVGGYARLSGLNVVFVPPQSSVQRVLLQELPSLSEIANGEASEGFATVLFPLLETGDGFFGLLQVSYLSEAPTIAAIAMESTSAPEEGAFAFAIPIDVFVRAGLRNTAAPLAGSGDVPDLVFDLLRIVLSERAISIEIIHPDSRYEFFDPYKKHFGSVMLLRDAAMQNDDRIRKFFFGLDAGTMSEAVPDEWRALMLRVNNRLSARVRMRGILGRQRLVPLFPRSPRLAADLREASMFVQTLMVTHLFSASKPDLVGWAFSRFAVEKLAVTHPDPVINGLLQTHGAPDGVAFFHFAELAFACIEHEVHESFWKPHLESLVCSAHVYAEHGAEKNFEGQYVYAYRENRRFPLNRMRQLEKLHARPRVKDPLKYPEDQFTSLVAQALQPEGTTPVDGRPLVDEVEFVRQNTADPSWAFLRSKRWVGLLQSF